MIYILGPRKWSDKEKQAVQKHMTTFLKTFKTPGKVDCEKCILASGSSLKNRSWTDVKNYVYNQNCSRKKSAKNML